MGGNVESVRRISRLLAAFGVLSLIAGGALVVGSVTSAYAATALKLTSTAAGVTCDNTNPAAPTCTGLAAGDVIAVSGTGFKAGSEASIEECNDDLAQAQVYFLLNNIPVSCTPLVISLISASGALSGSKTIVQGTTGPPVAATVAKPSCTAVGTTTSVVGGCTTSGNSATDAASYPCPPTAAQQAAGDTCVLAIGDQAGDRAIGTILFGTETAPTTTTTGAAGSSTTGAAGSSTTGSTTSTTGSTTSTTGSTTSTTGSTTSTTGSTTSTTGSTTTTTAAPTTSTTGSTTSTTGSTTTTTAAPASTTTTAAPASTTTTATTPPTAVTGAYELYCPGTPVGDIVLNDAVTSATLSPAAPTAGQSFSLTGYQTMVAIPASLASAAAALQPNLEGTATAQIDASGATPATTPEGPLSFNVTIPSPIPTAGVPLSLPSTPATISGFTATSPNITIQEDSAASLSLTVSGSALALTCTAYPNDSVTPSGIVTSAPTATPIAPVIAVAGGGSTTTTTAAAPTTTKPPTASPPGGAATTAPGNFVVTKPSSSLAFTGVGPGIGMLGVIGGALILFGFALLVLVDAPRRAVSRLVFLGPATWRRVQSGDMAERLGNLNPMRWRRARHEGVADTTITTNDGISDTTITNEGVADTTITTAPPDTGGSARFSLTRVRDFGDRFSGVPAASRDIAQTTARHAVRTAQWLLGR